MRRPSRCFPAAALAAALAVSPSAANADAMPVQPLSGGSVQPTDKTDVVLREELIEIELQRSHYEVTVTYTFQNTGAKQSVLMGFPVGCFLNCDDGVTLGVNPCEHNCWHMGGAHELRRFKALDGETELAVKRKKGKARLRKIVVDHFKTFTVDFDANQTKQIVNSYHQEYESDKDNTSRLVRYILASGASWKGEIESIKVVVTPTGTAIHEVQARRYRWPNGEESQQDAISFVPKRGFRRDGDRYVATFENTDPKFNIRITLPPELGYADASSTLASKKDIYVQSNVLDHNPRTAWVEGAEGHGIGEWIHVDVSYEDRYVEDCAIGNLRVSEIRIVNGYAQNPRLFAANSRVRRLRVTYARADAEECMLEGPILPGKGESFVWELKDTTAPQYHRFPEPVWMGAVTFTIEAIYDGKAHADTSIAEIAVIPAP